MYGCSSTFLLLVNAEVDSMVGVGVANRTSPRKAAIEKVQAELWQEYGVRDQRKKELEFLEKGGDPLDFKLWNGALISVQSTSITDIHPDQFVTSEAKDSFAFTASPRRDSVESSGRPWTTTREPISADNLMLFDVEHGFSEGGKSVSHPSSSGGVAPSKESFKVDGIHETQKHGDLALATLNLPRKAYKRRYRSRPNRDGARSSSIDVNLTRGCHDPMDVKGLLSHAENQNVVLNQNSKPTSIADDTPPKAAFTDGQDDIGLDNITSVDSIEDVVKGASVDALSDNIAFRNTLDEKNNQELPSDAAKAPIQMDSNGTETIQAMREIGFECQPSATARKIENRSSSCQMNGFSTQKGDDVKNNAYTSDVSRSVNVLDFESSCTQTCVNVDGNNDSEMCTGVKNVDINGNLQIRTFHDGEVIESDNCGKEEKGIDGINNFTLVNKESASARQNQQDNDYSVKPEEELNQPESENKVKDQLIVDGMETYGFTQLDSGRKLTEPSVDNFGLQNEILCVVKHQDCVEISNADLPEAGSLTKASTLPIEAQTSSGSESKTESKIDEDAILKEAQIIEAKRKRIAELAIATSPKEMQWKSHWTYVLEEMAWLANDFAQERIWKVAAASQISHRVAVAYRLRKQGVRSDMDAKTVAHTLAKAVMEFWQSVESRETHSELEQQRQKNGALSVRAYAVRLLKFIKPNTFHDQAEMPLTPDRISALGISDLSSEDNLTEENLFYTVPPGAGETYKGLVESHVAHSEKKYYQKTGNTVQKEGKTSTCDAAAAADFEYQENAYDEGEGETCTSSLFGQKKREHPTHAEIGSNLLRIQCAENKLATQQYALLAKRPGGPLNVSVPTKRMRTATRRVISPYTAEGSGCIQLPNKTDASSCDTNSFQDDRGLLFQNSLEVESAAEFENQLQFDSMEVSTRPKKKKKAKHLNPAYEQKWQVDSSFQNEQFLRDPVKKRSESHLLESNGNSGQPMMKRPKLMRQSHDNSFDTILPSGGSAPSAAASQMSNMSSPNKFLKMLGGRDRGRKANGLKMPAGRTGSGGSWSLFEDQALVVLVHDLGPNWELVSDAINSTLHFKCIFRKSKECKDRHNFLMDVNSGDGAESAEDSGSSQRYPSTLPGIPKGSARQLFQRLQGPMEEDTLKSHFEKIIMIGQRLRCRKSQEPKQLQQPHSSQTVALSQVCPNNLNGGHILTPLDLCDDSVSGSDLLSLGYQGPDSSGSGIPNQGIVSPMLPASGPRSVLQGSPNTMIGNNFTSSPGTLNPSAARDGSGRIGLRPGSLPADEQQQRSHQYNKMIPGRNIPQPNLPASPDGNGVGGANRNLPIERPGFRGIPPSSSLNPGSSCMASPVRSPANSHGVGQRCSMLNPRENSLTARPGPNHSTHRQTPMPGPVISQGPPHFSSLSPPFPNQPPQPVAPSYPLHHPPHPISPHTPQVRPHHPHFQAPSTNQPANPQQQAYAARLAKERQLQHRLLQQKEQQLASSSNLVTPHAPSQPQLPISPPMRSNNSPQTSSSPTRGGGIVVSNVPAGVGSTNQIPKQRQRPQNLLNRQHPQSRQQQAKVLKGVDRGHLNGISINSGQYVASGSTNQSKSLKSSSQSDNSSQQKSILQRVVPIESDPSNKSQVGERDSDQRPISSSAEMDIAITLPQASDIATNAVEAVSTSLPHIREDVSTQQPHTTVQKTQLMVQPQQQTQLLQARNGDLYGRSNKPRLE